MREIATAVHNGTLGWLGVEGVGRALLPAQPLEIYGLGRLVGLPSVVWFVFTMRALRGLLSGELSCVYGHSRQA